MSSPAPSPTITLPADVPPLPAADTPPPAIGIAPALDQTAAAPIPTVTPTAAPVDPVPPAAAPPPVVPPTEPPIPPSSPPASPPALPPASPPATPPLASPPPPAAPAPAPAGVSPPPPISPPPNPKNTPPSVNIDTPPSPPPPQWFATPPTPQLSSPSAPGPPPPPPPKPSNSKALLYGIGGGAGAGILLLLSCFLFFFFRKKPRRGSYRQSSIGTTAGKGDGIPPSGSAEPYYPGSSGRGTVPPTSLSSGSDYGTGTATTPGTIPPLPMSQASSLTTSRSFFTYDELEKATDGFATRHLLGEGGFGRVYKGKLDNGQVVAVKQLTLGGGQGEREFRAEVEIISRVHHKHLVSLVGYCIANDQRLLVYEFVPNGTLESALHDKRNPVLDWPTRQRIAIGAARGLAYLHEDSKPRIIHRDIKASNILLDENFDAEVADFGLAKILNKGPDLQTHVTTRVMGTFGYLAPEYAMSGKLTEKSDVFSFGVVLLELVSGRKPVDTSQPAGQESLVEWARPLMNTDDVSHVVDPELAGQYNPNEMQRMMIAAALCVRQTAQTRPKMSQVVRMLEDDDIEALLKTRPGYSRAFEDLAPFGGGMSNQGGLDYDASQFSTDMRYQQGYSGGSQWNDSASQGSRDDDYQHEESDNPYYPGRSGLGPQSGGGASYGRRPPQQVLQNPYNYGSQAVDPRMQAPRQQYPPLTQGNFPPRPRPMQNPQAISSSGQSSVGPYSSGQQSAYSGASSTEFEYESDIGGGFAPPPRPPGMDSGEIARLNQPGRRPQGPPPDQTTVMSMRPPHEGR